MAALDSQQQDITMLWWLQQPKWLQQFKAGRDLLDWAINKMKIPPAQFTSKEFQLEVSVEFNARGVRPVCPERVVANWKKDTVKALGLQEKWPKPYFPVMLQTRPGEGQEGSGAFIMFSSWQDAMIALREMAKTKRFHYAKGKKSYPATMVYENQLVDMDGYDFPCRIILDCDAKEAQFSGRYTLERLGEAISRVPEWFSKRLVEIHAIKPTDRVVVYEKEKSRRGKASRHYIFNIVGLSTWDTQAVLKEIFWKEIEKEKQAGQEEKLAPLMPHPWQVTDPVPHHGRGQYSVLGFFDAKKGETECPAITLRMEILNGKLVGKPSAVRIPRADMVLEHPLALKLLHRACYTCPVRDFITMDPKYMMQRQVVWGCCCSFGPAVRLELTRTPDGGRQKKGHRPEPPALDQAPPVTEAPRNRRSCQSGSSQRLKGSLEGQEGMTSTRACTVWTLCTALSPSGSKASKESMWPT